MSKTQSVNRRKTSKETFSSNSQNKSSSLTSISKYLTKAVKDEYCVATKASVPSPDDAVLPCSTRLISISSMSNSVQINHVDSDAGESRNCLKYYYSCAEDSPKPLENRNISNSGSKKKTKTPLLSVRNSQITDYFPVRRSNRKTSVAKTTERNRIVENALLSGREEGFEVVEYPDKGRGVITTKSIKRGEFVLEYSGELIDYDEAKRRENLYADKKNIGCYMYYFKHKNKQYCIDATKETDRLGRLVNHCKKGNLKTKTFVLKDLPHLILFASQDIEPGEELCYDYGDRRKVAVDSNPWLAS